MIDEKVIHKSWDTGVIVNFEDETITVVFDSIGEKKFQFPMAFEKGFLRMSDVRRHSDIMTQIENKAKADVLQKEKMNFEQKLTAVASLVTEKISSKQISKEEHAGAAKEISKLEVGIVYTNHDIKEVFRVSNQGGMRKSNITNSLVLVSKHSDSVEKNPYEDKWESDGLFHYTGMGLEGDQELNYKQNKTLSESNKNGVNIYLFESYNANEYIYRGEAYLAKKPYATNEPDMNGNNRRVYKFPLKVIK